MSDNIDHCNTCKFRNIRNECRRFPPQVTMVQGSVVPIFPVVDDDDWCGEWSGIVRMELDEPPDGMPF